MVTFAKDWLKWQEKVEQKWIETKLIDENPYWTRKTLPNIEKLTKDLLQHGQLQSALVRPHPNVQGRYQLAYGHRRFEAIKHAGFPKIRADVASLTDQQMLEFAVSENLQSEDITPGELAEAIQLMRDKLGYTYKEIGLRIGRSEDEVKKAARLLKLGKEAFSEVTRVTPEKGSFTKVGHFTTLLQIKDEKKQAELAREAVVRGWTREKIRREVKKLLPKPEPEFKPKLYNVWNFAKCDERFGRERYPGRIPGQIVQNVLYYYTDEGDLVVDPMAGSGTTKDVCDLMNRECVCYDNNPESFEARDDVFEHDIREGFPEEAEGCDLIFLDPPYWRLRKGHYGKESVSEFETYKEWLGFIGELAEHCYKTVKSGGYVALVTMAFLDEENASFLDLPFDCIELFQSAGFEEVYRISVPLNSQVKNDLDVARYKEKKIMLDLNRDLIIFRRT